MITGERDFELRLASEPEDLRAAQQLRYEVFVEELGGDGPLVDREQRLERDEYDPYYDHLMLFHRASGEVVGVYRLMRGERAAEFGRFYSETEYDLTRLKESGRNLLELGRSCLHRDFRGGAAMHHLWNGLAGYVADHGIEILFGVASFHGTDVDALRQPLSFLHHWRLAPQDLRARARDESFQSMDLLSKEEVDRRAAMRATPSLIKAYLRLGGVVGEGAWIDRDFNATDVCLILDTSRMNPREAERYARDREE